MSLVALLVFVLVVVLAYWIIGLMGLPEPTGKIVRIVVGALFLIYLLYAFGVIPIGPVYRLR